MADAKTNFSPGGTSRLRSSNLGFRLELRRGLGLALMFLMFMFLILTFFN